MRLVRRVVVIGLSNIGDAVLMSPVIQRLHERYPDARLTLFTGERAAALFAGDARVHEVVLLDDFDGGWGLIRLAWRVLALRPNVLIDLRHTLLPLLWKPWRALRYFRQVPKTVVHMRDRHLWKLETQDAGVRGQRSEVRGQKRETTAANRPTGQPANGPTEASIWITDDDRARVRRLVERWDVKPGKRLVMICPGARSHIKRWYPERFAWVADQLITHHDAEVVFTGETDEVPIIHEVFKHMDRLAHSAAGCTTVTQLAALLEQASLVIANDTATLHVAGAVGVPTLAIFGPTSPRKYGPVGPRARVIQRRLFCVPCQQALCRFNHECMRFISADEVYRAASQMLGGAQATSDRAGGPAHCGRGGEEVPHADERAADQRRATKSAEGSP